MYSTKNGVDRVSVGLSSDVGHIRDHNEDACLADAKDRIFIVSDGMGGAQAGELASKTVVSALPTLIENYLSQGGRTSACVLRRSLRDAILELSRRMHDQSVCMAGLRGMGATVAMVLIRKRWAYVAHLGDSRVYLNRNGVIGQLTADHSLVGLLLQEGEITREEAMTHPAKGRLTRYVGMEGEVYADVSTIGLKRGDRLLLCSDGLTDMLSDSGIALILAENMDPQRASEALVEAADSAGGKDNITAVVVNWS